MKLQPLGLQDVRERLRHVVRYPVEVQSRARPDRRLRQRRAAEEALEVKASPVLQHRLLKLNHVETRAP